jgi:hypothetical protein
MTRVALALVVLVLVATAAMAGSSGTTTATQSFNLGVDNIAALAATTPGPLQIIAPTAGGSDQGAAGDGLAVSKSDSALNYTSVIATGQTNTISSALTVAGGFGPIPAGCELDLTATPSTVATGHGAALSYGASAGTVHFIGDGTVTGGGSIVTGIGSCWTDAGATKGAVLTYKFYISDWSAVVASTAAAIKITHTITNN